MNFILPFSSALLFAAAAPASKYLLSSFGPFFTAGFSYFFSAAALFIFSSIRKTDEEKISFREDGLKIFLIILSGGTLAPFLMLKGLQISQASNASLLLNLETVFTSLIAVFFLKEKGGIRFWISCALIFLSAILLSFEPGKDFSFNMGAVFISAAALMWALDNNITASLSFKDPVSIALIKGLAGGGINIFFSLITFEENKFSFFPFLFLFLLGAFSYGLSLVLMIYSQRKIGAARTGIIFGSYPIISFLLSILFLGEKISGKAVSAFILTCAAFYLTYTERHSHKHVHEKFSHSHKHNHEDGHHEHVHSSFEEEHSHEHSHDFIVHEHEHKDDYHHKHH